MDLNGQPGGSGLKKFPSDFKRTARYGKVLTFNEQMKFPKKIFGFSI